MTARAIMLQGTGSNVGKSLLAAGVARACANRGLNVAPFKPQNMANNAAVTTDGGEIGRAQALQAQACRLQPISDMNPILLKPETDCGAQVIVQGQRCETLSARDYFAKRQQYLPYVLNSFNNLKAAHDLVIIEGAGSPAEVNLRHGDIANMGFAQAANVPCLLIGDIHRGGVIASIIGTLNVIGQEDAGLIKGFIINNFHGDARLFDDGCSYLKSHTALPCLGVVPHFNAARCLPSEDAVALEETADTGDGEFVIAVPQLSRIANFDDLDPLKLEPGVRLVMVPPGKPMPLADLIIVPGTKSTIGDLRFLRQQGWDIDILAHHRRGKPVLGICGGYQMLGKTIHDPYRLEGPAESIAGLGLLEVETILAPQKTLRTSRAHHVATGKTIEGYEIHLGETQGEDCARPFSMNNGKPDGAVSTDGLVMGTYLHGGFCGDAFRSGFLKTLGATASDTAFAEQIDKTLESLAEHLEMHLDIDAILSLSTGAD